VQNSLSCLLFKEILSKKMWPFLIISLTAVVTYSIMERKFNKIKVYLKKWGYEPSKWSNHLLKDTKKYRLMLLKRTDITNIKEHKKRVNNLYISYIITLFLICLSAIVGFLTL
jgi:hypothetical protein